MNYGLEIGDKIVCRESCMMSGFLLGVTTVRKSYIIIEFSISGFYIIDDRKHKHHFTYEVDCYNKSYKNWFYSIESIIRKKKLKKIEVFKSSVYI